jgi:hypothetical protein
VAAHPLRERLHGLLMLALYQDGQQGEALAAYQAARHGLVAELGTEPRAQLRELHQRMLTADPLLAVTESAARVRDDAGPVVPRQLPAAVVPFTGRCAELAVLTGLLERPGGQAPGAVVISAIAGTAGAGKTALAVQ